MWNIAFICDDKGHLICLPYTRENLDRMAEILEIKKCWWHKNHYDIPKKRIREIKAQCIWMSTRDILKIIKEFE